MGVKDDDQNEGRKKDPEEEEIEIRFYLRADAKDKNEKLAYNLFKEMSEHFSTLKQNYLAKMLIGKAYHHWFVPEIKKKKK